MLAARPRRRAACTRGADPRHARRAPSATWTVLAPRAASPESSAKASARRCCATRPTGPALDAARVMAAHDVGRSPMHSGAVAAGEPVSADRRLRLPVGLRDAPRSSRRAATSSGCACRGWTGRRVFGAMLDRDAGGFRIGPADTTVPAARRYLPGTMVLETTWGTPHGLAASSATSCSIGPWHHERRALAHAPPLAHRLRRRPRPAAHGALRERLGRDGRWTASRSSTTGARAALGLRRRRLPRGRRRRPRATTCSCG